MNHMKNGLRKALRELFLLPTHLYRAAISPLFPPSCIYTPSCSTYMVQSVREHGIFKGSLMGIARILRCQHWFFQGGPDPVPHVFSWKEIKTGYIIYRKHHRLHRFKPKGTHYHDTPDHTGPHASQTRSDPPPLQNTQEIKDPTPPTNG